MFVVERIVNAGCGDRVMQVLSRYLAKELFKFLILCLIVFAMIYLFVIFVGGIDNFLESKVSGRLVILYYAYQLPYIVYLMLPPSALIAVIIMFSLMKKNNEISALMASGVSLFRISKPVVAASCFLALFTFVLSETIVPYTISKANRIWRIEVKKEKPNLFYGHYQVWYHGDHSIIWIKQYDSREKTMKDSTFYFFDQAFRLVKRIQAHEGVWINGRWKIRNGIIQERGNETEYKLTPFKEIDLDLPETPETFMREQKGSEEMGYWELGRFAEKVKSEGYDATRYFVDLDLKVAFPFMVVIIVLMGIAIATTLGKGKIALSVSIGVAALFVYILLLGISRSLGYGGVLPPLLSAWLANGLFFFLAMYWMARAEH
jgi:lipopolysaccharide export system permease protein